MTNKKIVSLLIPIVFEIIYFIFASRLSEGGANNIILYLGSLLLFVAVYFIGSFAADKLAKKVIISQRLELIVGIVGAAAMTLWVGKVYATGALADATENYIHVFYLIAVLSLTAFLFISLLNASDDSDKFSKMKRLLFAIPVIACQTLFLYQPNIFLQQFGGLYHIDAYTNTIINVVQLAPYSDLNRCIYGHYGLFFILPVKLLVKLGANEWLTITGCIAAVGCLTFCCQYYVLNKITKNNIVFYLSCLAIATPSFAIYGVGIYYQVLPHRYLFPAITMLGILCALEHKESKSVRAIMWIVSSLALLWNFETGIIVLFVWTVCSLYIHLQKAGRWSIGEILKHVLMALLMFALSLGVANAYNLAVGGQIIGLKSLIYPVASSVWSIEGLQIALGTPDGSYFIGLVILLSIVCVYLKRAFKLSLDSIEMAIWLDALLGLGVFVYYMNRPVAGNETIYYFELVLAMTYIIEKATLSEAEKPDCLLYKYKYILALYLSLRIVSMAFSSLFNVGMSYDSRNIAEAYSISRLREELFDVVDRELPADTPAFGDGVNPLYASIGRDTMIHIEDWPDIWYLDTPELYNQSTINSLIDYLNENKFANILVNEKQAIYLPEGYVLVKDYYGWSEGYTFGWYTLAK